MKVNVLTEQGQAYISRAISGNGTIRLSNVKVGNGNISSIEEAKSLTSLKSEKKAIGVQSVQNQGEVVILTSPLNNLGVSAGFFVREIGIYAQNDDGSEILLWYINNDTECSYLSAESEGIIRVDLKYRLILSSDAVVVENNTGTDLFITKQYVDNELGKKLNISGGDIGGNLAVNGQISVLRVIRGYSYLDMDGNIKTRSGQVEFGANSEAIIKYNPETKSLDFVFNEIG